MNTRFPGCPACGCSVTVDFNDVENRTLLICNDCRHIFWETMPTLDELTRYYAGTYSGTHGQQDIQAGARDYYREHVAELAAAVRVPVENLAIADVGCSFPVFLHEARRAGAIDTVGVDWSREAQEYGQQHDIPVLTPPEFDSVVPDRSLDVLRYSHTLEHMVDPLAILTAQARKLRPGGLIYITQPNFPVFRAARSDIHLHDSIWPSHLHFFNPVSLGRMADAVGMTVVSLYAVHDPKEEYRPFVDEDCARAELERFQAVGQPVRGEANNFPWYLGPDCTCYLLKPADETPVEPTRRGALSRLIDARRIRELEEQCARLEAERDRAREAHAAVLQSTSWRVTAPLRMAKGMFGRG